MDIINATSKDATSILALQKRAFASEAEMYGHCQVDPLRQTEEDLQREIEERTVLKAVYNGQLVGSVRASEVDGICTINKLIVEPAFQGRGIGTRLMHAIEARFLHSKRYCLMTGERSSRNLRLYGKLGYDATARQCVSNTLIFIVLEKSNHSLCTQWKGRENETAVRESAYGAPHATCPALQCAGNDETNGAGRHHQFCRRAS